MGQKEQVGLQLRPSIDFFHVRWIKSNPQRWGKSFRMFVKFTKLSWRPAVSHWRVCGGSSFGLVRVCMVKHAQPQAQLLLVLFTTHTSMQRWWHSLLAPQHPDTHTHTLHAELHHLWHTHARTRRPFRATVFRYLTKTLRCGGAITSPYTPATQINHKHTTSEQGLVDGSLEGPSWSLYAIFFPLTNLQWAH